MDSIISMNGQLKKFYGVNRRKQPKIEHLDNGMNNGSNEQ
jgi:hypothetical protein